MKASNLLQRSRKLAELTGYYFHYSLWQTAQKVSGPYASADYYLTSAVEDDTSPIAWTQGERLAAYDRAISMALSDEAAR